MSEYEFEFEATIRVVADGETYDAAFDKAYDALKDGSEGIPDWYMRNSRELKDG